MTTPAIVTTQFTGKGNQSVKLTTTREPDGRWYTYRATDTLPVWGSGHDTITEELAMIAHVVETWAPLLNDRLARAGQGHTKGRAR